MLLDLVTLIGYACLITACLGIIYFVWPGRRLTPAQAPPSPPSEPTSLDWAQRIDAHCQRSPHYSRHVQTIALALADALGLPAQQRDNLAEAALLHDLGKLELPAAWFDGQTKPNPDMTRQLQWHPVRGATRASKLGHGVGVVQAIRWHKEQWDGMGFPDGLGGESIPTTARILALAETTCALFESKHQPTINPVEHIDPILRQQAGLAFDPTMTRILTDIVLPRLALAKDSTPTA